MTALTRAPFGGLAPVDRHRLIGRSLAGAVARVQTWMDMGWLVLYATSTGAALGRARTRGTF